MKKKYDEQKYSYEEQIRLLKKEHEERRQIEERLAKEKLEE